MKKGRASARPFFRSQTAFRVPRWRSGRRSAAVQKRLNELQRSGRNLLIWGLRAISVDPLRRNCPDLQPVAGISRGRGGEYGPPRSPNPRRFESEVGHTLAVSLRKRQTAPPTKTEE